MNILSSLFLALAIAVPQQAQANTTELSLSTKVNVLSTIFAVDPKTVSAIIKCESSGNPKTTHLNKNGTTDHGYFQVNDTHIPEATKRGLDITKPDDNLLFGFQLLKEKGLQPWSASKSCWQPITDV